jgi:hypothetical protein
VSLLDTGPVDPTLRWALKGDADAIGFVQALVRICDVWDDLIDRDATVQPEPIHQAFYLALVDLPGNPFYRAHFAALQPVIVGGILSWWASNRMESSPYRRSRQIAFIARSQIAEVITMAAGLVGGIDWARSVGPDIKRLIHSDDMGQYLKELESKHGMAESTEG